MSYLHFESGPAGAANIKAIKAFPTTDRPTVRDDTLVNAVIGGKMVSASVDCCRDGRTGRTGRTGTRARSWRWYNWREDGTRNDTLTAGPPCSEIVELYFGSRCEKSWRAEVFYMGTIVRLWRVSPCKRQPPEMDIACVYSWVVVGLGMENNSWIERNQKRFQRCGGQRSWWSCILTSASQQKHKIIWRTIDLIRDDF